MNQESKAEQGSPATPNIIELVVFKLVKGATVEQLTGASVGVSDWVCTQPGFVSRELFYSKQSEQWVDFVRWESLEAATAASEAAMSAEQCGPMFGLIDMAQTTMLHADPVMDLVLPAR